MMRRINAKNPFRLQRLYFEYEMKKSVDVVWKF